MKDLEISKIHQNMLIEKTDYLRLENIHKFDWVIFVNEQKAK